MIRDMKPADLDAVALIWLDTNIKAHDFIPSHYWEANLKAVKEMLLEAELYVYEDERGVQGFVGLDGDYIPGIFVQSEAQSKGIGRRLLAYVKNIRSRLTLNVYAKNRRAAAFYQREGFSIQREQTDENTGEQEYFMEWER